LDGKTNPRKHNIHGPRRHDIAMHDLLNSRRPTASGARKPKVSKANGIKTC